MLKHGQGGTKQGGESPLQTGRGKHFARPPSMTDSAKKGWHKHQQKGAKRRIGKTRDVTHLGIDDSYIPYTVKYAPETGSHS